jgi:hypothetical protein
MDTLKGMTASANFARTERTRLTAPFHRSIPSVPRIKQQQMA